MSKEDGDMIIKYGEQDSEIVTDELISVMMLSVETDFNQGNVLEGLKAALFNGMVLIEENIALYQDTHEVYEKDESEGFNYILVTDVEDGDGEALILKDLSEETDAEAIYEIVAEDSELEAVATVFENLLDDVDLV